MTFPTISLGARFDKTSMTLTELGAYAQRIRITKGRQRFLERANPGQIVVELDNSGRAFDVANLSGPFVSGGLSQVLPMVQLLVKLTTGGVDYYPALGFADSWQCFPAPPDDSLCVATATDGFKVLNQVKLQTVDYPAFGDGTVSQIMQEAHPSSSYLSAAGVITSDPQPTVPAYEPGGRSSLDLMQELADTDRGDLIMRPTSIAGNVVDTTTFLPYYRRQISTPSFVFSDDPSGAELLLETVSPFGVNDDLFCTEVTGQRIGGTAYTASSPAAVTANAGVAKNLHSNSSLRHADDDQVATWTEGVLYRFSDFETAFSVMTLDPAAQDSAALWAAVCGSAISTRITVKANPPGGGSQIQRDHFVEGFELDIVLPALDGSRSAGMTAKWLLSDASRFFTDVFILDDATRGKLDTGRLGF